MKFCKSTIALFLAINCVAEGGNSPNLRRRLVSDNEEETNRGKGNEDEQKYGQTYGSSGTGIMLPYSNAGCDLGTSLDMLNGCIGASPILPIPNCDDRGVDSTKDACVDEQYVNAVSE